MLRRLRPQRRGQEDDARNRRKTANEGGETRRGRAGAAVACRQGVSPDKSMAAPCGALVKQLWSAAIYAAGRPQLSSASLEFFYFTEAPD
ncbi:hypothetical protein CR492_15970 [Methylocella silvestris]|uniref:Uncharacterized protein n=1 Tax=Methylocella silvestris TaxID=199596 RepID=A0A2J7TDZ5_METSI|nr:hypothetical protein CR492_15970 [Methylocella silvestris]